MNEELLKFYRILGSLKRNNTTMHDGDFFAEEIDSDCIMIKRMKNEAQVAALVNRSNSEKYVFIPTKKCLAEILIDKEYTPVQDGVRILIPGNANMIFETKIY